MPVVPSYQREIRERPIFQQGVSVRASADDMGAAVGRGLGAVAQGMGQASVAMQQLSELEAVAEAKEADNQYASWLREEQYGENGFMTLEGKAAVDARSGFEERAAKKRQEFGGGLSPEAGRKYTQASEARLNSTLDQSIVHTANARKKWFADASTSRIDTFSEDALAAYQNPDAVNKNIAAAQAELREQSALFGWDADTLKNREVELVSGIRQNIALRMAQLDPVAAKKYADDHKDQLTGPAQTTLENTFAPLIIEEEAKREASRIDQASRSGTVRTGSTSVGRVAPNEFAADDLPSVAYGLLGAIRGPESGHDYGIKYGGAGGPTRFSDFSDHPRTFVRNPKDGTQSSASGAYQFIGSTWDGAAKAIGANDFSPPNQDRGAWFVAQRDYRSNTGRDLTADLQAGRYGDVRRGLGSTWAALKGMSDAQFAAAVQRSGSQVAFNQTVGAGNAASYTGGAGSPTWGSTSADAAAGMLDEITNPLVRQATMQRLQAIQTLRNNQQKAQMEALKTQAFGYVDQGQSPDAIPAEIRAQLGREEMSGLWSYFEARAKGGQPVTDDRTLYDLQTMYAQDPAAFGQMDLFQYRSQLDDASWKEVNGWRQTALTDQRKAAEDSVTITTAFSQAKSQLEAVGITTTGRKGSEYEEAARREAQFQNMLAREMQMFQENEKRAPNQIDIQAMINRLLLPVVVREEKSFLNPTKTPWSSMNETTLPFFEVGRVGDIGDGREASVYMEYEKIPAADRIEVETTLEVQLGRKPSKTEVAEAYAAYLASAYQVEDLD